jgi:hypothetical protein
LNQPRGNAKYRFDFSLFPFSRAGWEHASPGNSPESALY